MAARAAGVDLVARNYYSPIPAWEDVPAHLFERRDSLRGIRFDLDGYLEQLAPLMAEFEPPGGFTWDNGMYDAIDADVLYATVRDLRPARLIELGSGFSSLIIAAAVRRNLSDGYVTDYTVYDPFARDFIRQGVEGLEYHSLAAVDVPASVFDSLRSGDLLFIDTTHTVKLGSEVNRIILDVLPGLSTGVSVHIHDVFLPYEYPKWFFENRLYWAEQYLLQAFLTQNQVWEITLPLFALTKECPKEVARLVPSFRATAMPGAFWMRSARDPSVV